MLAVRQDEADRRDELRAPLARRDIFHVFQQFIVVGFIVAVVAAVAGAVNARSPIQSIHAEAGVIGDGGHAAGFADGLGLDEGIGRKGGARFLGLKGDAQLFLAHHLVALRFQNAAQLPELARIACCCTNFHIASFSRLFQRSRLLKTRPLCQGLPCSKRLPRPGEVARKCRKGSGWHRASDD